MQARPDLVKREVREGQLVGNHTWTHPNIAATPLAQTDLEINTHPAPVRGPDRALDALLPPALFRRRRAVDARRGRAAEDRAGPRLSDRRSARRHRTTGRSRTPAAIVQTHDCAAEGRTGEGAGQVVLLHDAGGDRSRTVAALPALIDAASRATATTLVSRRQAGRHEPPPRASRRRRAPIWPAAARQFRLRHRSATSTSPCRACSWSPSCSASCAWSSWRCSAVLAPGLNAKRRAPPMLDAANGAALISVLIPCFNEEKRGRSTRSQRILNSSWPRLEVLVLDDGSTDGTAAAVRGAFGRDPRVQLLRFPNGGKARALNRGLAARHRRDRGGAGRRHPVPARHHRPPGPLVRRSQGGRRGRQRHGRQPAQPDHPLAGAGIRHRPEPGAPRARRRWASSPWCRARSAPGGARPSRRLAASRPTPWPRTRT